MPWKLQSLNKKLWSPQVRTIVRLTSDPTAGLLFSWLLHKVKENVDHSVAR